MLAGALFGPWYGLLIACTLSTLGSTNCYLLSRTFGKRHVIRLFPEKVTMLQQKVRTGRGSNLTFRVYRYIFQFEMIYEQFVILLLCLYVYL